MSQTDGTQSRAEDRRSKQEGLLTTEEGSGHLTVHGRGDCPDLFLSRACCPAAPHTLTGSLSPLFQIYSSGGELQNFIDGYNVHKSNWMRYVNPARSMAEQNLVACQNNREIYFYTIRPVEPSQELLVWYSQEFAQRLCGQQSDTKPSECIAEKAPSILSLLLRRMI